MSLPSQSSHQSDFTWRHRAGFWRRLLAFTIDGIVVLAPFDTIVALLYRSTGGAFQAASIFTLCEPAQDLPTKLEPPPPLDTNTMTDCRSSFFGLETRHEFMALHVTHEDTGTMKKTVFTGNFYYLDTEGRQIHPYSLDWILLFAFAAYLVILQHRFGATLGMWVLKIVTLGRDDPNAAGIPWTRAVIRTLALWLGVIPVFGALSAIMILRASSSGCRASISFCSRRRHRGDASMRERLDHEDGDRHDLRRCGRRTRRNFRMTTAADQASRSAAASRAWHGVPVLSRGFRPFFLAAGAWALIGMALWLPVYAGAITIPTAFSAVDWHAHEMIFGYAGAVVAGFLLTAIPNWTGRLPVAGWPLAALAALWAAGRVAVLTSAWIGRPAAAIADAAFLTVFAALVAREVIKGRNWRNLKVAALVFALALIDVAFHVEDARSGSADTSIRAALGLIVMLILLIGGRVTPSFTGNWLAKAAVTERPAPFGRADGAVLGLSGLSLAFWVVAPEGVLTGALALAAAVANLWRLSRWRGLAARRDALVLVLHLGFLFAALGFVGVGAHALWPDAVPYAVGVHVWAIGAVGMPHPRHHEQTDAVMRLVANRLFGALVVVDGVGRCDVRVRPPMIHQQLAAMAREIADV
jgi:uncharacterized protein involved in response to NO